MNEETTLRVLQNVLSLFVEPEIRRRHEEGIIAKLPFALNAAQIILPLNKVPIVRLNDEAKIAADIDLKPGVNPQVGAGVSADDIHRINRLFSVEPVDQDSGHIAIKWLADRVILDFDFRYNKATASTLVAVSEEFLQAAHYAKDELQSWSVFVETLFSSLELAVKAFLWTTAYGSVLKAKMSHFKIRETFASFPVALNGLQLHSDALTELSGERNSARYLHTEIVPRWADGESWLRYTEDMLARAKNQTARPYPS